MAKSKTIFGIVSNLYTSSAENWLLIIIISIIISIHHKQRTLFFTVRLYNIYKESQLLLMWWRWWCLKRIHWPLLFLTSLCWRLGSQYNLGFTMVRNVTWCGAFAIFLGPLEKRHMSIGIYKHLRVNVNGMADKKKGGEMRWDE